MSRSSFGTAGGAPGGAAETGALEAMRIVFVGSTSSRYTCGNAARIVAASTFSRSCDRSGWPMLTMTMPPGASLRRTVAKNSRVAR